jgi:hypothetical protein
MSVLAIPNVGNVGAPSIPLPSATPITGAGAPALPVKVPRGDSNVFGNIVGAAGKGVKMALHRALLLLTFFPALLLPPLHIPKVSF